MNRRLLKIENLSELDRRSAPFRRFISRFSIGVCLAAIIFPQFIPAQSNRSFDFAAQQPNSLRQISRSNTIPALNKSGLFDFTPAFHLVQPTVKFIGVKHYAYLFNQVSVGIRASDKTGLSRVELYLDGALLATNKIAPNTLEIEIFFSWNTTQAPNGKHILEARVYNVAGAVQTAVWAAVVRNLPNQPPAGSSIILAPAVRYQTMNGWEATGEAAQLYSPAWNVYKNTLLDQAVNDLGINRIRLEIYSGAENPTDFFAQWRSGQITEQQFNATRFQIVNDNSDPNQINPNNFQWSQLDNIVDSIVVPMRQRLAARGEQLYVNLNYVDFGASAFEHKNAPAEYAEFVLATYQHMQSKYGFVPDSWEVILEPDTSTAVWSGAQVAQAIKAAGDRLAAVGFTPRFVAPSTTNAANAPVFIDQIAQVAGAMNYVSEFSYHRYCCVSDEILQRIASRAATFNKRAAMLEWIGADYHTLHEDLKVARNSAWQQYTLAFNEKSDNGAQYYLINDANPANPVVVLTSRAKFLRQYFRFVRAGAQRIEATSGSANFDPLAFVNTNGKYAVVVKAAAGGAFNIQNLPAGTYGVKYTTGSQYDVDLPDVLLAAKQTLNTNIPAAGVITIYAK